MKNKFIPVCEPALLGNEMKYVTDAVSTGWISSSGKYVQAFEERFAEYCGSKYAVGVCNGTMALHLALTALSIGPGDEVIIPDFTMIASAFAVCYTGAKPVFVDAEKETWNIDVDRIEEKITGNTRAIMTVSIFGHPCDMDTINTLAQKHHLRVIEDAAESHGAEYNGVKTGALADITAFSFFANKNLTTGEGGMVVTNDEELYERSLYYKNLCFPLVGPRDYIHNDIGFNYRLSNVHAAIGLAQVEKADEYRSMRIKNGEFYTKLLSLIPGVITQRTRCNVVNVHWMNSIAIDASVYGKTREQLMDHLSQKGIDTRPLFVGMHRQPSLVKYGCDCGGDYPVTDSLSLNGFYLPSASTLKEEEIEYICETINSFRSI